jgi:hypothetical protein
MKKLFILIVLFMTMAVADYPCYKIIKGKLTGRWISLYGKYPPGRWQKDVWIHNPGNPNWWDAEFEIIGEDSIKVNSNFEIGWEYMVVLTNTDCEEIK